MYYITHIHVVFQYVFTHFFNIKHSYITHFYSFKPANHTFFRDDHLYFFLSETFYHMNGISRYFTFFLYSIYPARPSSRTFSSLRIRTTIAAGYSKKTTNEILQGPPNFFRGTQIVFLFLIPPFGGISSHFFLPTPLILLFYLLF